MARPGNTICLSMLVALAMKELLHMPAWGVMLAAFAIGWYYNERERTRDA